LVSLGSPCHGRAQKQLRKSGDDQDTIEYLRSSGRRVIYDAERIGLMATSTISYAIKTLEAATLAVQNRLVLYDTKWWQLTHEISQLLEMSLGQFTCNSVGYSYCDSDTAVANAAVMEGAKMEHNQWLW